MSDDTIDFFKETELALLLGDNPLEAVVKLPLHAKTFTAKDRDKRGRPMDFHMRLPKGLLEDLRSIAKRYPTPCNTLIRIFLELAVKQWVVERAKVAEEMKPQLEQAAKRTMGEGRNK